MRLSVCPPTLRIFRSSLSPAAMKTVLLIAGIVALLMGLLWIGQGAGFVHWPASSFMIDQRPWVSRGAVLALVGFVLVAASRRR